MKNIRLDTRLNQRIAVQPGKEHVDAYEGEDHHDEIHERKVAAPGDEGLGLLGIPGPEASPGGLRPESAKENAADREDNDARAHKRADACHVSLTAVAAAKRQNRKDRRKCKHAVCDEAQSDMRKKPIAF